MVRFWVRECRWLTVRFARRTCSRTLLVELRRTVAPIGGFGLRLRGWEREMTERSPDGVDVLAGQWPGPFVEQVDGIQYRIGEGPCITAAATGGTVRSGSLTGDPRWPGSGPGPASS